MNILAIESSCDETAVAIVQDGRRILSDVLHSQVSVHREYGGVVPEIASRQHMAHITRLYDEALAKAGCTLDEIDAIAVTCGPGLVGALLVGLHFAKGLALCAGKPLVGVHHLRAHVAAGYLAFEGLKPPFVALVASGGHSHIVHVADYTDFRVLGRTRDDAAGECFDKIGRVLGLPYPAGAPLDALAQTGNPASFAFPQVQFEDAPFDFSFSGVKTSVMQMIHNKNQRGEALPRADIAAAFNEAAAQVLASKLVRAALETGERTLLLSGGVGANSRLRTLLSERCAAENLALHLLPLPLCGDNAAMVGAQGYFELLAGHVCPLSLNAYPNLDIGHSFEKVCG